jgi:hypothetical protein
MKNYASNEEASRKALEGLFSRLRELYKDEYVRGSRDAIAQIAKLAQKPGGLGDLKDLTGGRLRAPRGASRELIERVLRLGPHTINEIRKAAITNVELMLSYQTLRLELERGKKQRRYKKTNDKWAVIK